MRTAIVSDLHLGAGSGEDVLRNAELRETLFAEIGDADRVVLLGDVVELRGLPLGTAMERARPFFEELGAALGEREVIIAPGNHDHRFAEPLLDALSLDGRALALEQRHDPSPGPTALIDGWLGPARLRLAYPGLWLRDDVYATHGHYMDAHLNLPRAECLAAAARMRTSGPIPSPATPADYERVLRPLYGFAYAVAQNRSAAVARNRGGPSEAAWKMLSGSARSESRRAKLAAASARRGFPAGIWALNRLFHSEFEADITPRAIFRGGVEAGAELAARLQVDGVHVITGHTHRGGPNADEAEWPLAGGGHLHNTGSWVFSSIFHHPGTPPGPYWPGTVTWVEDSGPPRRVQLLLKRSHAEMTELVSRMAGSKAGAPSRN
jgi:UDP-2,3-diacylglucosamine pyrophosphatase LpxH